MGSLAWKKKIFIFNENVLYPNFYLLPPILPLHLSEKSLFLSFLDPPMRQLQIAIRYPLSLLLEMSKSNSYSLLVCNELQKASYVMVLITKQNLIQRSFGRRQFLRLFKIRIENHLLASFTILKHSSQLSQLCSYQSLLDKYSQVLYLI